MKLDIITLDTHTANSLAIADVTKYAPNFNIVSPTIEVTPPGFAVITLDFNASSITVLNSTNLGISCEWCDPIELPDGVWTVKYTVYPSTTYSKEITFLRTERIMAKLDELYLTLDFMQCDDRLKSRDEATLDRAYFYINGAIAAANKCATQLAIDLYSKANKLIENYINHKTCVTH
jgi:hypothetical protein